MISCPKALSAGMQPIFALMVDRCGFDQSRKLGKLAQCLTCGGQLVTAAAAMETLGIDEQIAKFGCA